MGISKEEVHTRVANIVGVPLAQPSEDISIPSFQLSKRPPKRPPLKRVRITKERGDLTRSGYIYKAMTNLGVEAAQLKYDVMLRSLKGVDEPQKVANKQTTPEGGISCTVPELVHVATKSEISGSNDSLPPYPVRGSKVYIKWEEQKIGEDTYAKGRSAGLILRPSVPSKPKPSVTPPVTPPPKPPIPAVKIPVTPPVTPLVVTPKEQVWYFDDDMLRCKVLLPGETISKSARRFTNRRECSIALMKHIMGIRKITPERPAEIARPVKRELTARAEALMKKRSFPKAVKEAIKKGLARKEPPRDIEQIIEKVAKTNEPNYVFKRLLAKRIRKGGAVQYKVETDKGVIAYETADEQNRNAILGMPMPTGEIIPLQIKVIR